MRDIPKHRVAENSLGWSARPKQIIAFAINGRDNDMWQPIETAPKGEYYTVNMGKSQRKAHKRTWVHTWRKSDNHRSISCYIPEDDRWNGYTKDAGPDMWHPYPDSPIA